LNIHSSVDVEPIGDPLFDILDYAWQKALAETGDSFDRRYKDLTSGVGLALLTASDRSPRPLQQDNPLEVNDVTPFLAERGTDDVGNLKYRFNHQDHEAVFNPSLLGVPSLDQISGDVLRHGRYPINGAAKRLLLMWHTDWSTSHDPSGLNTGIYGTIGAAGAIRDAEGKGIVTVSGGNQAHDHVAGRHWLWMANGALETPEASLNADQFAKLEVAVTGSMKATIEHIKTYVEKIHKGKRLDEIEHHEYAKVLQEADSFLLG
jgi:hypothetical protein